jgi:hypothetical protein
MRSLDEKNGPDKALFGPFLPPTISRMFGAAPLNTAFATGVAALSGAAGRGKSRPLKP